MDPATALYEIVTKNGVQSLSQLIFLKQSEGQLLDFKQASNNAAPLTNDDKRNLSRCLGAFANADGGVLVWGIKCRPENGVDVASKLFPINNINFFLAEIETLVPQLLQPYPSGIKHQAIFAANNRGFVASLVPYWDGPPVRSTLKDKGSDFFLRAGNQTIQMPYTLIAERFGQRPLPKLRVVGKLISKPNDNSLYLFVTNIGRGLARAVTVIIKEPIGWPPVMNGWGLQSGLGDSANPYQNLGTCFEAPRDLVVYPNMSRSFFWSCRVSTNFIEQIRSGMGIKYQTICDGFSYAGEIKLTGPIATSSNTEFILEDVEP